MYSHFHLEIVIAFFVLFSRVIRPIKCQSKPTTSRKSVGSCYLISMPVSAQHKWHFPCQFRIHDHKSQISCASGLPQSWGCGSLSSLSQTQVSHCLLEEWIISASQVSFPRVRELLGGGVKEGQSQGTSDSCRKDCRTLSPYKHSAFWHLPSEWDLNANEVQLSVPSLLTPASLTRKPDAHCPVLTACILGENTSGMGFPFHLWINISLRYYGHWVLHYPTHLRWKRHLGPACSHLWYFSTFYSAVKMLNNG